MFKHQVRVQFEKKNFNQNYQWERPIMSGNKHLSIHFLPHRPGLSHVSMEIHMPYLIGSDGTRTEQASIIEITSNELQLHLEYTH